MRILITGGAGFIGSNFVRYWHRKYFSDEIVILDKLTYAGHLSNLKGIIDHKKVKFVHGDICDELAVSHAMKDCDIVVHFAAESHVDRSITGPRQFVKTNVLGTQVLLDAALENGEQYHSPSSHEILQVHHKYLHEQI